MKVRLFYKREARTGFYTETRKNIRQCFLLKFIYRVKSTTLIIGPGGSLNSQDLFILVLLVFIGQ